MIRLLAFVFALLSGAASACESVTHRDRAFTICTADLSRDTISLHLRGADGQVLGSFVALEQALDTPIRFAMNAGMYHPDRRPVGLYVEDGEQVAGLVTREGPGNFGLLPNGVFCVTDSGAQVIETRSFSGDPPPCRHATQSGPMLVIDGELHPRFLPDSPSLKRRNGVGIGPDGRFVHFVISDEPATFHELATLYRDVLGVRNALFLDGSVSRLYAPGIDRHDGGWPLGPILAVTGG